jgi:hypothetical protein
LLLIISLNFYFEHGRNTLILLSWSFGNCIYLSKKILRVIFLKNTYKRTDI